MSRYIIAFDDSGGIERLCDWSGNPVEGDHPLTVLTGVYIDRAVEAEFNENCNALRARIGEALRIDDEEVVTEMKRMARLDRIGSVTRVANSDQQALVQAADLIGFMMFRRDMASHGFMAEDMVIRSFLKPPLPMNTVTRANFDHIVTKRYPDLALRTLAMDYSIARSRLAAKAPEFASEHLVSVDGFFERATKASEAGAVGVSVLKSPEMAKTPD